MSSFRLPVPLLLLALLIGGCGGRTGPYSDQGGVPRDIHASAEVYKKARAHRHEEPAAAEHLLRRALDLDLYNGPAHNDLGVLLLQQGRLYEAAQEFEWARKLMPGHPDPRVNLAVVLQRGGKARDSIESARTALEVQPGYLPAIQTLAYVQIRHGLIEPATRQHLDAIVMRSRDERWREWATMQRFKLDME